MPFHCSTPRPYLAGDDNALEGLASELRWVFENVGFYAVALGMAPDTFDRAYDEPHIILRMSRYPPLENGDDADFSLVPHTDSGFMTLLAPSPAPGLSIQLPDGRWIDAPGVEHAFVPTEHTIPKPTEALA